MSSRPVTPSNSQSLHLQSQQQPRRNPPRAASNTRIQQQHQHHHQLPPSHSTAGPTGSSSQTDNQMLATAHFQGHHVQYAQPPNSIFEIPHHDYPVVSSLQESMFALPVTSSYISPSVDTGAASSVSYVALSSGDLETRKSTSTIPASAREDVHHDARPVSSQTNPSEQLSESEEMASNAPPRKKRTRTLTTAHQSSVLLALLSRTPFPTTAEREEVGRAIGLTARKVQVWFQNQRQKQKKAAQTGTLVSPPHTAATSAPLPLSRQPGFSAHHAARMGVSVGSANPSFPSPSSPHTPSTALNRSMSGSGYGHYSMTSPTMMGTPTTHMPDYRPPSGTTYGPGLGERPSYYSLHPARSLDLKSYSQATSTPGSRPQTSHSHTVPSYPNPNHGGYVDPYGQPPPRSAGGRSFGQGSASHAHSLSDEYSLPPPSEASLPFSGSPSDAWRYKPLPPLPPTAHPTTARPSSSRGRSGNWEYGSANNDHRELRTFRSQQLSRSRAFSNPNTAVSTGYEAAQPFAHVHPLSATGPSPPQSFGGPSQYQSSPPLAPSSYHGPGDYQHNGPGPGAATTTATTTTRGGEGHYSLRFGEAQLHRPPADAPSSSSSYLGGGVSVTIPPQAPQAQHQPAGLSYSPVVERRRNRLSYDSSLTSPSLLGKRSWSVDEDRVVTKRARTDDGHRTVPVTMGPLPPTSTTNQATATNTVPPLVPVSNVSHQVNSPYLISPQTPLSQATTHALLSHRITQPPSSLSQHHHLRQQQQSPSDPHGQGTHTDGTHTQGQHQS
ncbi:hypothetical protein FRC19_002592 [Serendipita sp. 401]|nr:hypothetical protein FRC19_002592 [Serendipita sp. 401]KAG8871224.1 hypothetical protein FRC20_010839 [Serendipita sp. 405]